MKKQRLPSSGSGLLALLVLVSGCVHGGTGPVLGVSNVGPVVGWEGSYGYGPLVALAGTSLRPMGGARWASAYLAGELAIGAPLGPWPDPNTFVTGGASVGGQLSTGDGPAGGLYVGAWGAVPWSANGRPPCEELRQFTPMVSVTAGVRLFLGHDLWEAYLSPKLGFTRDRGGCPDINLRVQ